MRSGKDACTGFIPLLRTGCGRCGRKHGLLHDDVIHIDASNVNGVYLAKRSLVIHFPFSIFHFPFYLSSL